jgi:hypothetical protein
MRNYATATSKIQWFSRTNAAGAVIDVIVCEVGDGVVVPDGCVRFFCLSDGEVGDRAVV